MPTVDIIVLTFNQENYIEKAFFSILSQTIPDDISARIIAIDDYSEDHTFDIISKISAISSIKTEIIKNKKNLGIPYNYKYAFELCKADYIAILEGDDFWTDSNKLSKQISFLESHPDCVFTTNGRIEYNDRSGKYAICSKSEHFDQYLTLSDAILNYDIIRTLSTCVFRSKEIQNINPLIYEVSSNLGGTCVDRLIIHDILQRGYGYAFGAKMTAYRINTGHNASANENNSQSELQWYRNFCEAAKALLSNDFSKEFYELYTYKKKELQDFERYKTTERIKDYLPPFLVDTFALAISTISKMPHVIRQAVPNKIHRWIKQIIQ